VIEKTFVPKRGIYYLYWEEGKAGPIAYAHKDIEVVEIFVDGKKIWDKDKTEVVQDGNA